MVIYSTFSMSLSLCLLIIGTVTVYPSFGPLCLVESPKVPIEPHSKPTWVQWLYKKCERGNSVLYVAFGSQVEISPAQLKEIATRLEESKVNFLWVIRKSESELLEGFEKRVKEEL
jgi:hypothetical protein